MNSSSTPRDLGRTIAFLGLALAWLIPNHYPPWTSFYNESSVAVALLALFAVALSFRDALRVPLASWALMAIAAIPALQWAVGLLHFSGDAAVASGYLVGVGVALFTGHAFGRVGQQQGLAASLSVAALAAGTVSAAIAVTQAFEFASWGIWAEFATPDMRAGGNLAQPNNFATLLGLGALASFYLYERGRLPGVAAIALTLPLALAGALTQSRISLLFGVLAGIAIWLFRRQGLVLKTPIKAVAALTLVHWLLMAGMPYLLHALFGESPDSLVGRGVTTPRYQMWRMLIDALSLVPWTGYGWLQVGAAELAIVDRYPPIKELWLQGHNIFVELLVWCGWPLGLLLGAVLLYWFASRVLRVRTLEAAIGMMVFSFVGLHALVELPHHYAYFLLPVGLWAGIVESEERAATRGSGHWMLVPAVAALVLFLGIWSSYPAMEEEFRLVRFEAANIDRPRAADQSADAPLMSSLTAFLRFARTQPVPNMSDAQLLEMKHVVERYPYSASLVRYASALALNGQVDLARDTFVKIRYVFGDRTYTRYRNDLQDRVRSGETELAALDRALPDFSALPH